MAEPKRYVRLADGRAIGLGRYVAAWKACKALPDGTPIGRGVDGYGQTAAEALRDLRAGLADRINRHSPGYGRGRKWSADWQRHAMQAASAVNTPRLIVRWLPGDLMKIPRLRARVEAGRAID
ncbi:hypothetical protein ABIF65_003723 [Bradyrhizobium japonicum]|jgi:hypothetical protein|uniref:hypothetical protein n=1 Tax=Bradyrhizobium TaxID=374 RepID=UPI0004AF78F7|nr:MULTISPECIES: hypothetical protein [Bradyrhizobium]MBR0998794.1 hypothetical protein [Bradyrhizobium liaoningense]MBR1030074.1 hypothetical protein [Bradyrhizobium liaoningense]MBR1066871.1 hypothetical protein [Bradyrhizobium liaoningense]MDI2075496.1 hypothetical protein [Bradyrhizobium sp. Mp27]